MKVHSILAIDPGEHTGWVQFELDGSRDPALIAHGLVHPADYATVAKLFSDFLATSDPPAVVICERWINIPSDRPSESEIVQQEIGVLRYITSQAHVPLILPVPQARMQITSAILEKSGYYLRGRDYDHVRQATRHALAWLVDQHHRPTVERLYPREA